ncbi:MFS transporter [Paraburkholderia sp. BCC1884]|uniref:MFS transporter n=1 Tax=Paraburkholderia sp. BCC1884 TaxID=2562668 RepID=UPI0011821B8F|nr:MFS transporter [Paraburkholderia sp. BCC1884]
MYTPPAAAREQPIADLSRRRAAEIVFATSLIGGLELFDFTVFGFFAAMIGDQFFPSKDPLTSLLLAVATFGVGFFMRPLGAVLIGAYADRGGRRAAFNSTIWLTSLGTAAIALCPPFATIGVAAPVILVAGRLLQGFAAGGDVGVATTLAMEFAPPSRRGFMVGWQLAGQGGAALLGATLGMLLTQIMSPAALASWGWRIPFFVGLLIVPAGIYFRRRISTPDAAARTGGSSRRTLAELCREHGSTTVLAMLMMLWRTVPVYAIVFFMPSYMTRVLHLPGAVGFSCSALSALLLVVMSPFAGLLADRLPRRKPLVLATSGLTALAVYPVFLLITQSHAVWPILLGVGLISALIALGTGANTLLVLEALPVRVRASGLAISYAFGVALFGGTAQSVVTGLVKWTGDPMSAVWYIAPSCAVSFFAAALFKEQREQGRV